MGLFSSGPEGISSYKWRDTVFPTIKSRLGASYEKATLIDGLFHQYFYGDSDSARGLTEKELDNTIAWLKEHHRNLPCRPFSEKDIEDIHIIIREFFKK